MSTGSLFYPFTALPSLTYNAEFIVSKLILVKVGPLLKNIQYGAFLKLSRQFMPVCCIITFGKGFGIPGITQFHLPC